MRAIVILVLIVIAIGLARMLVGDIIQAVSKSMKSGPNPSGDPQQPSSAGRLVKDPETGRYIDENTAFKAEIKGKTFYFESAASRDAYLRKHHS